MKIKIVIFVLLSLLLCSCNFNDVIVAPDGPKATELGKEKDNQIKRLEEYIQEKKKEYDSILKQASLAAANFESVNYANDHVEDGLPKEAIKEESNLGKSRLESIGASPDPQEIIKGKDRVIAILEGNIKRKEELYNEAFQQINNYKREIEGYKNRLSEKDSEIDSANKRISVLEEEAKQEKIANLIKTQQELKELRDKLDKQELDWMAKILGLVGAGCILAGIIFIALTKGDMFIQGGLLSLLGGAVVLFRTFLTTLVAQPWFPIVCGIIFAIIVVLFAFGLYKLWKKIMLDRKKSQAIQDFKDESKIKGTEGWKELKEHLVYRIGDENSYWGSTQKKELHEIGMINKKAEDIEKQDETTINK